ncbi:TetR/AcrR family transcriptional regulator [Rhodococcus opacus]|uniref:TetR/AcrR family transcriptional regulator n=1 Tax=Rhodococcus opacus TaxID=37919 RepID=UPI000FFC8438|nr:TetR/AcrR family transcriptional regulator [Rhodococcus opacus]
MSNATSDSVRPRSTQAARSEAAVKSFLEVALRLVGEKGSARMTLSEVGTEAGYSRGNPGRHFGTKTVLIQELARYLRLNAQESTERVAKTARGLDYILAVARVYISEENLMWVRALHIMQAEAIMPDADVREQMQEFNAITIESIEHHIRLGMEVGEIPSDQDAHALAVIMVGLVRGVMVQWLVDDSIPLDQIGDTIETSVARMLGVPDDRLKTIGA